MAKESKEQTSSTDNPVSNVSKDEIIGYHKGAINTLIAERTELIKIVSVTENLIQAHAQELQKLGVNLSSQNSGSQQTSSVPIEQEKKAKKS